MTTTELSSTDRAATGPNELDAGDTLSISDAARAIGVSTHTLRYYERAGLMLDRVPRATSTHRRYRAADVSWVVFLIRLRATGMPIRALRQYTEMVRAGAGNEANRLELLERHRTRVVEQLTEMQRHLEVINRKIEMYHECVLPPHART